MCSLLAFNVRNQLIFKIILCGLREIICGRDLSPGWAICKLWYSAGLVERVSHDGNLWWVKQLYAQCPVCFQRARGHIKNSLFAQAAVTVLFNLCLWLANLSCFQQADLRQTSALPFSNDPRVFQAVWNLIVLYWLGANGWNSSPRCGGDAWERGWLCVCVCVFICAHAWAMLGSKGRAIFWCGELNQEAKRKRIPGTVRGFDLRWD